MHIAQWASLVGGAEQLITLSDADHSKAVSSSMKGITCMTMGVTSQSDCVMFSQELGRLGGDVLCRLYKF